MINAPDLRSRVWLFPLFCIVGVLGIGLLPRPGATQDTRPQISDAVRAAQINKAKKQAPSVRKIRKMLKDAHLPLEAADLFSPFWYRKVAPYSNLVPDLTKIKSKGNKLKGVHVADTMFLPEKVELTDDTLIIARQVVFAGKNVEIKGNHDLTFLQNERPLSTNEGVLARGTTSGLRFEKAGFSPVRSINDAIARGLLVEPQTISINVDGYGREQWLEDQEKKKEQQKNNPKSRAAHHGNPQQQADGTDKTGEGAQGADGAPTFQPGQQSIGTSGNCSSDPNGGTGVEGDSPGTAGTGGTGGNGDNGGNAGTLNITIPQNSGFLALSAKGGQGQKGGRGGPGGFAAPGGQGGTGGPGALCACPLNAGNGGQGGRGGTGGRGGNGGNGGPGGMGGNGGTINITKPCDFNSYSTNVTAGARGPGGDAGDASQGGEAGQGGEGGTPKSNSSCSQYGGVSLGTGPSGTHGSPGARQGEPGAQGEENTNAGSVPTPTNYGNCGGGSGGGDYTDMSPGGGYDPYCQPYDWVWIHCDWYADEEEARLVKKYDPTVKANHYVRALPSKPSYECYEVARWYAGCF
jgi:hypothetical protein